MVIGSIIDRKYFSNPAEVGYTNLVRWNVNFLENKLVQNVTEKNEFLTVKTAT